MYKLKYLNDNRDLAILILSNREYDPASIDMLDHFMKGDISGNIRSKGKDSLFYTATC